MADGSKKDGRCVHATAGGALLATAHFCSHRIGTLDSMETHKTESLTGFKTAPIFGAAAASRNQTFLFSNLNIRYLRDRASHTRAKTVFA